VSEQAAGAIYDLGYRHYEGARLSYSSVLLALYIESVRIAFGIGRRFVYKAAGIVLLALAIIPAVIALGIAAVADDDLSPYRYDSYYELVSILIALFCAAVAPDLVGRDIRNRTLALYISRGISRMDYIAVKLAALVSATLIFSLIPQLMLFVGNILAADNAITYFFENLEVLPQIVASAFCLGLLLSSLAVCAAAYATNRIYATGGFIALVVLSTATTSILVSEAGDADIWRYIWLGGVFNILDGANNLIFATSFEVDSPGADADLWGGWFLAAIAAFILSACALTARRYLRLSL
jgi:ABC-2 type transport system permease protein